MVNKIYYSNKKITFICDKPAEQDKLHCFQDHTKMLTIDCVVVGEIRQGVSKSVDVCFKYKALMLTFGSGRESRSWGQLKISE
jgi:hypothetical protein